MMGAAFYIKSSDIIHRSSLGIYIYPSSSPPTHGVQSHRGYLLFIHISSHIQSITISPSVSLLSTITPPPLFPLLYPTYPLLPPPPLPPNHTLLPTRAPNPRLRLRQLPLQPLSLNQQADLLLLQMCDAIGGRGFESFLRGLNPKLVGGREVNGLWGIAGMGIYLGGRRYGYGEREMGIPS